MNLLESVFRRKSTRKYDDSLCSEKQNKIRSYLESVEWPDDNQVEVKLVRGDRIHSLMNGIVGDYRKVIAPHYLMVLSKNSFSGELGSGYVGEEVVLKLTSMGVATCWIGKFGDPSQIKKAVDTDGGALHALIACGLPTDDVWRDKNQAKRKDLDEIILYGKNNLDRWINAVESVRYAPSSLNLQPWRLKLYEERVDLYIDTSGLLKKIIGFFGDMKRLNNINAGIALKHLELGVKDPEINFECEAEDCEESGYRYIASVES